MATGGMTPIRGNDAYIGFGKQSAWGTAVAPTYFPYWLDGSEWGDDFKTQSEMQGDTGVYKALVYRSEQHGMAKLVQYLRPINAGMLLAAALGVSADTYTAPTFAGTLSAAIAVGATSFQTALNLGATGTLALNFTPGLGVSAYETQTVDLTTKTGVGPFTYSLASGGKFINQHASGDAISSASNHSFARTLLGYAPYTIEYGWGQRGAAGGNPQEVWQLRDSVCTDLKISGETGKPLRAESTWVGTISQLQAAQTTPVYEGVQVIGQAGSPFMYYQAGTTWRLDGAAGGNAASISKFDLQIKNTTDVNEFLTEALNPAFFQPGNIEISASLEAVFQSFAQYNEMYYGSQSLSTGATPSYLVGYGSFAATWLADALNSFGVNFARGAYTGGKLSPKLDGKSLRQPIQLEAIANGGVATPLTLALANSQASAY